MAGPVVRAELVIRPRGRRDQRVVVSDRRHDDDAKPASRYWTYRGGRRRPRLNNTDGALSVILAGGLDCEVETPGYDQLGRLITGGLLRPRNHDYIPAITNLWPVFHDPWYVRDWRYSVPCTVYTTGIGWRTDQFGDDVAALTNPYAALWNPQWDGHPRIGGVRIRRDAATPRPLRADTRGLRRGFRGRNDADTRTLNRDWQSADINVPLKVVESPYREMTRPVLQYIKRLPRGPGDVVCVYIPQTVLGRWWENHFRQGRQRSAYGNR